ncbi:Anti-sigma F factor antagonist (spoIIAA-2); Anti-sigma B factor antagonist RsbV [hydrothermal vent metagenome]|uniref:Anti-sigma F factor antagonist (SpoIIAA-2) Anti-sigma B factor antagonist RsbV n=1 Tax=hydrothermal vent metagenome TaxID=652676 RepID=A0A3B0WXD9_9ZZZZ
MSISLNVSSDNKIATISIIGRFDFSLHNEFRKSYKDVNLNSGEYQIDLSSTEYLDSSALGMLLLLKEHAESQGNSVKIKGYNAEIKEILMIASFDKIFVLA